MIKRQSVIFICWLSIGYQHPTQTTFGVIMTVTSSGTTVKTGIAYLPIQTSDLALFRFDSAARFIRLPHPMGVFKKSPLLVIARR
jgi:hypothetical protein